MSDHMTFRVLGPHERGRFAPEAWGHLLALNGAGILNAAELEQVIERAMAHLEGRIALDDLRALMESGGIDDSGTLPEPGALH
jgi:Smg protein